jgi:hypothetical protein
MAAKRPKYGEIIGTQSPLRISEVMGGGGGAAFKLPTNVRNVKVPAKTSAGKAEGASKGKTPTASKGSKTPTSTVGKEYNKPPKEPLKKVKKVAKKKVAKKKPAEKKTPDRSFKTDMKFMVPAVAATLGLIAVAKHERQDKSKKTDATADGPSAAELKSVPKSEDSFYNMMKSAISRSKEGYSGRSIKDMGEVKDTRATKPLAPLNKQKLSSLPKNSEPKRINKEFTKALAAGHGIYEAEGGGTVEAKTDPYGRAIDNFLKGLLPDFLGPLKKAKGKRIR